MSGDPTGARGRGASPTTGLSSLRVDRIILRGVAADEAETAGLRAALGRALASGCATPPHRLAERIAAQVLRAVER